MNASGTVRSVESFLTGDVVTSSRNRGWPGIEVMTARIVRRELDITGLRTHTLAINTGSPFVVDARIDGRSATAAMATSGMLLIEAGVRSEWRWTTGALDMLHLSVDDDALRAYADELALPIAPAIRTRVGFDDHELLRLGAEFAHEMRRPAGGALVTDALRIAFIMRLLERYSSVAGRAALRRRQHALGVRTLRRLDEYINEHLGADIGLDDLARQSGLSRFHFARAFRATAGTSPYRYLLRQRLERARALLIRGRAALSDVAAATGFADQSHLTRALKQRFGVTPAVLRRNAQDCSRR